MSQTMLPVEDVLYKNRNIVPDSYYAKCVKNDLISKIHSTMKQGGYYLSYDGIYRRRAIAVGVDTPWHHVKHLNTKKCGVDHNVKFNIFGYVPPRCMECWKVVAKPRTIKELFLLLEVEKSLNRASKCGIELRYYTPRLYGGYFYNNSLDEGRHCYEIVRRAVDEHISKGVGVILKRGCTEYELALGPSAAWHITDEQYRIDEKLESMVDTYTPNTEGQTDACIAQVHTHWMEWAWKNQDPTVKEFIGDMPLYPETMTYHTGDLNEIKLDLMRAKAKVKYGIEPEVTDSIHTAMAGFNMTKRVGLEKMGGVLGFDGVNPLFVGEGDDA
ncbi:MAG: hypothetical protein U9Q84_00475 [Thermodesulfobacteriota bacterium]|nr:hypothetical protein [Thermodesulfobacteriota bacterium]